MSLPFGHAVYFALHAAGLQLLACRGVGGREEQRVGPRLVADTGFYLCQQCKIVVVEALAVHRHVASALLVPHFYVAHGVVVFGVAGAQSRAHDESCALFYELGTHVGLVGVEGTDAIGSVEVVLLFPFGDDVDGSTQRVGAEAGGHHSLVDFYVIYDADRQVGQRDATAFGFERKSVDEIAHGIARQTIDRQVEVAAHTAFLTHLDPRRASYQAGEADSASGQSAHVYGVDAESTFAGALYLALAIHLYAFQADGGVVCGRVGLCPCGGGA